MSLWGSDLSGQPLIFLGGWNANTNNPTLASLGVGGDVNEFYIVEVAGSTTIDGHSTWAVGDWILNTGSVWERVPNATAVTSVAGRVGAVTIALADITDYTDANYIKTTGVQNLASKTIDNTNTVTVKSNKLNIQNNSSTDKLTFDVSALTGDVVLTMPDANRDLTLFDISSSLTTLLSGKQATITGGATTITTSDLTASKALASSASGKVAASSTTVTELGYLSGVTSNIQTQLNALVNRIFAFDRYTTDQTLTTANYFIECDAPINITLPTAIGKTGVLFIIKAVVGISTILTTAGQTIDSEATQKLNAYESISVVSNGDNWIIY